MGFILTERTLSLACQGRRGGPKGRPWYTGEESHGVELGSELEDTECSEDDGKIWVLFFMSYIM